MSYYSKTQSINTNAIQLKSITSTDVDITCLTGDVRINGIVPTAGGGGGGGGPYDGPGNIRLNTGNFTAEGDGLTTGVMTGQTIASVGKVTAGGNLETNADIDIKNDGSLTLEGDGNIIQQGTGKITSGSGGIESLGDIKTIGTFDLEIGGDIYFDGNDIFHRTANPAAQKSYKDYKQLAGLNDANIFTGANQFNDNTTEFAAKVSVGTRDAVSDLFTQNLALNSSGNIESKTINNTTLIQCGNINCGNAALNEVRARQFKTRTNENNSPEGWTMEQQTPSNPVQGLDRSLVFKGGEANAFISVLDSAHSGFVPNIVLDPRNSTDGGLIAATVHQVGQGGEAYWLTQPNTGADADNLLIRAGLNEGSVKFKNNASTIDLAIIQRDSVTNQGRLYCPAIFFGTTGVHNSIVNDTSGADSLVLKVRQATASSKVEFLDNADASIMEVKKTEIELGPTIPIKFGGYSFRPQQYSLTKTLTIAANPDTTNFTNMAFNCRSDTWNNINAGGTVSLYNALLEGFYRCTVSQTGTSSAGNFIFCDIMFDYVLRLSTQTTPDIEITEPTYGYRKKPTNQGRPTIRIDHLNTPVQSQPVFVLYSGQSAGETMPIEVRLTKLDF